MTPRILRRPGRKHLASLANSYIAYSAALLLTAHVYGMFGHGVRSAAMDLAFVIPLGGAAAEFFLRKIAKNRTARMTWRRGEKLLRVSVDGFVFCCMCRGVFDIAGIPFSHSIVFVSVGVLFLLAALATFASAFGQRAK